MRLALIASFALAPFLAVPSPLLAQVRPGPVVTRPMPQLPAPTQRPGTAALPTRGSVPVQIGVDLDGDGVTTPADCDDRDASRYPGAAEEANDGDEDCNPSTIGDRDADGDGYTSNMVSNVRHYGPAATAGLDCNDAEAGIRPTAQELPNRIDDDCDGAIDDLIGTWWTPGRQ